VLGISIGTPQPNSSDEMGKLGQMSDNLLYDFSVKGLKAAADLPDEQFERLCSILQQEVGHVGT